MSLFLSKLDLQKREGSEPNRIEGVTEVCSKEHSIYLDGADLIKALQLLGYSIPTESATVSALGTGVEIIPGDCLLLRVHWITVDRD